MRIKLQKMRGFKSTLKVFALNEATGERIWQFDTTKEKDYGKGFMPSYQHLKDDEKRLLISYLLDEPETDAHLQGILSENRGRIVEIQTAGRRLCHSGCVRSGWSSVCSYRLRRR